MLWDYLKTWFSNREQENTQSCILCDLMDGINQIVTNTCHHNKNLNYILNHLHWFWDKSLWLMYIVIRDSLLIYILHIQIECVISNN